MLTESLNADTQRPVLSRPWFLISASAVSARPWYRCYFRTPAMPGWLLGGCHSTLWSMWGGKKKKLSGVESFQHLLQKASRATRCFWCERPVGVTVVLRCTTAGLPSPSARFSYTSEEGFCTSNKGLRVIFQSRTSKSVAHANIFPSVQKLKSQRPFCWLGLASFQWITAPFFAKLPAGRCQFAKIAVAITS